MSDGQEKDLEVRKEFAKVLNLYEYKHMGYIGISSEEKLAEPSWLQIFAEIGKILKTKEQLVDKERLDFLERKICEFDNKN